jgi:hypothetical protein
MLVAKSIHTETEATLADATCHCNKQGGFPLLPGWQADETNETGSSRAPLNASRIPTLPANRISQSLGRDSVKAQVVDHSLNTPDIPTHSLYKITCF